MELTEEQYKQAARYVDGEMDASERQAFEASLMHNNALVKEVEAYREIRALGNAIADKLNGAGEISSKEKARHAAAWDMLQQARQHWEHWEQHHKEAGQESGLLGNKALETPKEARNDLNKRRQLPEPEQDAVKVYTPGHEEHRLKTMNGWKWVAAALIAGVICSGVLWWYAGNEQRIPAVAGNPTQPGSEGIAQHKEPEIRQTPAVEDTGSLQNDDSPPQLPSRRTAQQNAGISRAEREQLVKLHFVPDSLPLQEFDALETPSAYYKDQRHEEAIAGYKEVIASVQAAKDPEPVSRGQKETELLVFLAHYYMAQSYLSVSNPAGAARELKAAIKVSPDSYWKSKAEWYLALAYIRTGQISMAGKLLQQVGSREEAGAYRQKAISLNTQLKQ